MPFTCATQHHQSINTGIGWLCLHQPGLKPDAVRPETFQPLHRRHAMPGHHIAMCRCWETHHSKYGVAPAFLQCDTATATRHNVHCWTCHSQITTHVSGLPTRMQCKHKGDTIERTCAWQTVWATQSGQASQTTAARSADEASV